MDNQTPTPLPHFPMRQRVARWVRKNPLLLKGLYYLYRFIQPKYSAGVVGIIWNTQRQVLIVEHVFHPKVPWGLPGGWVGWNEAPSHAVMRELREELGLEVTIQHLVMLEKTQYNHLDIAYLCQTNDSIHALSNELLGYHWVALTELPQLHKFHYQAIIKSLEFLEAQS